MVSKTEGEMKMDELGGENVRDPESGTKAGEKGVDQQTGQQKTRIVIAMVTEPEKGEETATEKEAMTIEVAEGSVREVEARTDTDLQKVSLRRHDNMAIV
jgi:hypothetical protein